MQNDNKERYIHSTNAVECPYAVVAVLLRQRKEITAQPLAREDGRAFDDKCCGDM